LHVGGAEAAEGAPPDTSFTRVVDEIRNSPSSPASRCLPHDSPSLCFVWLLGRRRRGPSQCSGRCLPGWQPPPSRASLPLLLSLPHSSYLTSLLAYTCSPQLRFFAAAGRPGPATTNTTSALSVVRLPFHPTHTHTHTHKHTHTYTHIHIYTHTATHKLTTTIHTRRHTKPVGVDAASLPARVLSLAVHKERPRYWVFLHCAVFSFKLLNLMCLWLTFNAAQCWLTTDVLVCIECAVEVGARLMRK
jgi:hypothetical protein